MIKRNASNYVVGGSRRKAHPRVNNYAEKRSEVAIKTQEKKFYGSENSVSGQKRDDRTEI